MVEDVQEGSQEREERMTITTVCTQKQAGPVLHERVFPAMVRKLYESRNVRDYIVGTDATNRLSLLMVSDAAWKREMEERIDKHILDLGCKTIRTVLESKKILRQMPDNILHTIKRQFQEHAA